MIRFILKIIVSLPIILIKLVWRTFIVKINHTDNASWQGQVTWADKNITKNFRSTLELIKLMDGAITSEETKNS